MNKLAVMFTGQGSQFKEMGLSDLKNTQIVETFKSIYPYDPLIALQNNALELEKTEYVQPLIVLTSLNLFNRLATLNLEIDGYLGFSLGEITAFIASGVFSVEDGLRFVLNRASWMQEASLKHTGGMAAVLGLDKDIIKSICAQSSAAEAFVMPVNFNTIDQTVISGHQNKIDTVIPLLKEAGAKRVLPLSVSGAFHTPLMYEVSRNIDNYLSHVKLNTSNIPIYLNFTARPHHSSYLKKMISQHVYKPVYFFQTIQNMVLDGFTHFIEIGPKPILINMVKKIDQNIEVIGFHTFEQLNLIEGWLKTYGFIS